MKIYLTHGAALLAVLLGYVLGMPFLLAAGAFALSGSITNSVAIHMLFEKVPLFYGSGVIEARFDDFKFAIYELIMTEFFTAENIQEFFAHKNSDDLSLVIDFESLIDSVDLSVAFDQLVDTILESSYGPMLGMLGGRKALEGLREPFLKRIREVFVDLSKGEDFQEAINQQLKQETMGNKIHSKVSAIIQHRLDSITPEHIKMIISRMIRQHLGWLVVWGGVFGAILGVLWQLLVVYAKSGMII